MSCVCLEVSCERVRRRTYVLCVASWARSSAAERTCILSVCVGDNIRAAADVSVAGVYTRAQAKRALWR